MRPSVGWFSIALIALGVGAYAAPRAPSPDSRADLFVRRGCADCHTIAGLGVVSSADAAPDLTYAYGDVVYRYGTDLESFLANPVGIMRQILAVHLVVNPAERDSMVQVLRDLYAERTGDPGGPPARRVAAKIPGR